MAKTVGSNVSWRIIMNEAGWVISVLKYCGPDSSVECGTIGVVVTVNYELGWMLIRRSDGRQFILEPDRGDRWQVSVVKVNVDS